MLQELLSDIEILNARQFVLVDIGASGSPPAYWQELAPFSWYVGFDPDSRELNEENIYHFQKFSMVRKVVADDGATTTKFFLTAYPYCSSMLEPDPKYCQEYSFTETFEVVGQVEFPATALHDAMRGLGADRIDWLKLDTQGKDLDLFASIDPAIANKMLAIDIEPGILPFYKGENTFDETQKALLENGFWLAGLKLQNDGFPRIKQSTRTTLAGKQLPDGAPIDFENLPVSPTALEARYFRTLEHLDAVGAELADYVTLWAFAASDRKLGFALDVSLHVSKRYPAEELGSVLLAKTLQQIAAYQRDRSAAKD